MTVRPRDRRDGGPSGRVGHVRPEHVLRWGDLGKFEAAVEQIASDAEFTHISERNMRSTQQAQQPITL